VALGAAEPPQLLYNRSSGTLWRPNPKP